MVAWSAQGAGARWDLLRFVATWRSALDADDTYFPKLSVMTQSRVDLPPASREASRVPPPQPPPRWRGDGGAHRGLPYRFPILPPFIQALCLVANSRGGMAQMVPPRTKSGDLSLFSSQTSSFYYPNKSDKRGLSVAPRIYPFFKSTLTHSQASIRGEDVPALGSYCACSHQAVFILSGQSY
jgi:hypothetical protein